MSLMSSENTKKLIAVVGPTASGKTSLAIRLAKQFRTEIVSADSRQFYKEITIGTAVPSKDELGQAKHHFIQHLSIHQTYNVGKFEKDATTKISDLFKQNDVVILVGGSGLFIDAVCQGLNHYPTIDPKIREELNLSFEKKGLIWLQEKVKTLDPVFFSNTDIMNHRRLIRCLEVCIQSKKPFSSFQIKKAERAFNVEYHSINIDREELYNRINIRVDKMLSKGLIDEAKELHEFKQLNALNTVGYKELFAYFDGNLSKNEAINSIKQNTRRFAKRQITWIKKYDSINWS